MTSKLTPGELWKSTETVYKLVIGVGILASAVIGIIAGGNAYIAHRDAHTKELIDVEIGPLRKVIKWFLATNPAANDSLTAWSARQDCLDAILRGEPCRRK